MARKHGFFRPHVAGLSGIYSTTLREGVGPGPELVSNGGFDSDTVWSKGANWAIAAGKATHTTGVSDAIAQNISITAARRYRIAGVLSGRTVGSVTPRFTGGTTVNASSVSANGAFEVFITSLTGNISVSFVASGTFDGSLDDISVRYWP